MAASPASGRLRKRLAGLGLAAACIVAQAALSSPAQAAGSFTPVADAYVDSSLATSNFGTATTLKTDGSPLTKIYMKFDLSGVDVPPSAALKVWVNSDNALGFRVHEVADTSWGETTITANNAPPIGDPIASSGPVSRGNWYTIDVSRLIAGDGLVSLAILTSSSASISISSRESGRSPQIVLPAPTSPSPFVVTQDGGTFHADSQTTALSYTGTLKSVVESAVVELDRAGGGTIRFQSGDYDLGNSQFEFYDMIGVTFEGAGMDQTTIRNVMSATTFDTEPFDVSTAYGVTIRDMTVNAGGPLRSTSDAIDFDGGNNTLIERVKVAGSRARGIIFDGKDVVGGIARTADNNVIRDCVITGVPGDGIEFLASRSNRVEGCTITDVGRHGIQMAKSSSSANQPHKKSNDNVITGNTIDNSGEDGVNVTSGDRNQIVGNTITNSSDDVSSRDGIRIASSDSKTCNDNTAQGNTATDTQSVKTQRYGLAITSSLCNRTVVVSNDFAGNKNGQILDQGTDTQYAPPAPDSDPPTAPTLLSATPLAWNQVDLTWTAATDNIAVAGYRVRRDGSVIASVGATSLSYSDTTVVGSTTYVYTVEAFDAAGNTSPESNAVSATTPAAPAAVTFAPVADSYVNESSPTSNYGASTQLRIDGSPLVNSYLRFDVEGLSGPVTQAKLRIYANTSSSTGYEVRSVDDLTWAEMTITYANAPAFGAVAAASGPFASGAYIEVDVTSLVSGNRLLSLALTGPGATAVSFGSRESTTPPQLVVETAPP